MIDLGDVYRVAVDVRDADGELVNPATAVLTITLPDGTTTSPPVTLPPAETGKIRVDYTTSQAGRHVYRLVTTGPATAHADMFEVAAADTGGLVSLADAKAHLNIPASRTADDEELRGFIAAATAAVERHVGTVVRREHVETFDGGRSALILSHAPVLSVTQVVEAGVVVDPSGYVLDAAAGVLVRTSPGCWAAGPQAVQVTYVAGRTAVPAAYSRAALIIVGHMWETQRNTSAARPPLGETEFGATIAGSTFSVPRKALELLGDPVPGVA